MYSSSRKRTERALIRALKIFVKSMGPTLYVVCLQEIQPCRISLGIDWYTQEHEWGVPAPLPPVYVTRVLTWNSLRVRQTAGSS